MLELQRILKKKDFKNEFELQFLNTRATYEGFSSAIDVIQKNDTSKISWSVPLEFRNFKLS